MLLTEQLREQVGNLMAAAQLLAPAIQKQENRHYDQYMAILNQSLYRLLRLTEHLELTGRERRGESLEFRPAAVDPAELCRTLCGQVEELAARMKVSFRFEQEGMDCPFSGDEILLRRMLLNLIANALHAAGEGGRAGLRLSMEKSRVRFTVWDDGPGRVLPGGTEGTSPTGEDGETLLRTRAGLGLGLPIAREIAAGHSGTLVYERGEGRGVRAVVSLPVKPPEENVLHTPRMGYDPTGGFSQVLVELADVLPYEIFLPEELE